MVDHKQYVREELAKEFKRIKNIHVPNPIPVQERSKFLTNFLVSCIFLVAVATILALATKSDFRQRAAAASERKEVLLGNAQPVVDDGSEKLSSIESRITDLEKMFNLWGNRIWLLGIASNENASMSAAINKKYHPNEQSDYISFDRDWKLNRMPRTLDLQDKDKERLQRNVNVK
jgi:hypothetical protein